MRRAGRPCTSTSSDGCSPETPRGKPLPSGAGAWVRVWRGCHQQARSRSAHRPKHSSITWLTISQVAGRSATPGSAGRQPLKARHHWRQFDRFRAGCPSTIRDQRCGGGSKAHGWWGGSKELRSPAPAKTSPQRCTGNPSKLSSRSAGREAMAKGRAQAHRQAGHFPKISAWGVNHVAMASDFIGRGHTRQCPDQASAVS